MEYFNAFALGIGFTLLFSLPIAAVGFVVSLCFMALIERPAQPKARLKKAGLVALILIGIALMAGINEFFNKLPQMLSR